MADISERLQHRLRQFAEAISNGLFAEAVREHFLPLPIIRSFGTEILETRDDLVDDLSVFWRQWTEVGVQTVTPEVLDIRSFCYGAYLVDVEWVFRDIKGTQIALVHTTYGFREEGERLGITVIFSHDETLQRPIHNAHDGATTKT